MGQQAVDLGLEDKIDPEYIALSREVPADQLGKPTVEYKMQGDSRQGVEMIIVPKAEVAAFESQADCRCRPVTGAAEEGRTPS